MPNTNCPTCGGKLARRCGRPSHADLQAALDCLRKKTLQVSEVSGMVKA